VKRVLIAKDTSPLTKNFCGTYSLISFIELAIIKIGSIVSNINKSRINIQDHVLNCKGNLLLGTL
jgi:hypothetical protein